MNVILVNDDPFGNNFRVTDANAGNVVIFNDYISAHGEATVTCRANDAGHGHIFTYQDNNPGIGRDYLEEGQRISL
jgi:hypothetical protein